MNDEEEWSSQSTVSFFQSSGYILQAPAENQDQGREEKTLLKGVWLLCVWCKWIMLTLSVISNWLVKKLFLPRKTFMLSYVRIVDFCISSLKLINLARSLAFFVLLIPTPFLIFTPCPNPLLCDRRHKSLKLWEHYVLVLLHFIISSIHSSLPTLLTCFSANCYRKERQCL